MSKRTHTAVHHEMMHIIQRWTNQGGHWPATASEIADFAVRHRLYNYSSRLRVLAASDLAKAMREEYLTDENGRAVRKLHAARFTERDSEGKKVQRTFWADIDTAEPKFMSVAFHQRRQQIVGDCRQLFNDVEYFNSRKKDREPIQLVFDFRDDIEEANLPDDAYIVSA